MQWAGTGFSASRRHQVRKFCPNAVGHTTITVAGVPTETKIARGDQLRISVQPGRLHFDPETELPVSA